MSFNRAMKGPGNSSCNLSLTGVKTAFLEFRRISVIRHYLSDDATKTLLFLSYSHALTIATLSWLVSLSPWSANYRVKNCAARLVVRAPPHVHITSILRHLHWLPVRARISYRIASLCFNTIIFFSPAYLSDLLHLHSPSRSLRPSADTRLFKIPLYKCKTKGDRAFS